MKPSIIVWDLETVLDLHGFAAANDLVGNASQVNQTAPAEIERPHLRIRK
jgi:hypothetical protein